MHPELIKAHIKMAGSSASKIARKLGLHRSTVTQVIEGTGKSRRVADEIAKVTGKSLDELWPGKYGPGKDST
jgi:putative transcriptional regulator